MMRFIVSFAVVAALVVPLSAQKADERIAVFVFTEVDPSGYIDFDQVRRTAVVKDAIFRLSRSKLVRTVESRADAKIVVEVGRTVVTKDERDSWAAISNSLNSMAGGLNSLKPRLDETRKTNYRSSTLSIGTYSTELESQLGDGLGGLIDDFVKLNLEQLRK